MLKLLAFFFALLWTSVCVNHAGVGAVFAHTTASQEAPEVHSQKRDSPILFPRLAQASETDIDAARKVVKNAIAEMTARNKARLDHPARNTYLLKPGTRLRTRQSDEIPPLLDITPEIASAAALLADLEAAGDSPGNSTISKFEKRANFWMESIPRRGAVPTAWGGSSNYQVFRDVTKYGADKSGKKDATSAIMDALLDGKRCAKECNGATNKNAIVYFPQGTYLVSSSIEIPFGTQLIGDANAWPTIRAASSFTGLGVLSTNKYIGGETKGPDGNDPQYYVNTGNFYRQIRNLKIDVTAASPSAHVCGIHYQVAQATSLQNVELIADRKTNQRGMFSENGSGGVMADVTFNGGDVGFYGGNQQFSADRMTFKNCNTAAQIIWDWGWVWKSLRVENSDVGFRLTPEQDSTGNIGSMSFMDSVFSEVGTAVIMTPPSEKPGSGTSGLILDNTRISGPIKDSGGNVITGAGYYKSFVLGPVYQDGKRTWTRGRTDLPYNREKSLLGSSRSELDIAPYFERPKEQYKGRATGDFKSIKAEGGAKGDGVADDTAAVQNFFNKYGDGASIIYIDAGVYILTDTVVIPKNAKIVGELWPQFAASGAKFSDASKPRVMLKVGKNGEMGNVEIQDLILTTLGGTAGAVLMEWNVKAEKQGSAALWDVHVRIGGATGSKLTHKECPAQQDSPKAECQAASLIFHLTDGASGYFDNMWLWVADHTIDDPDLSDEHNTMTQCSIYVARGFLVESKDATWLYGTSSEHSVMYQYNFHGARNIVTTMIQTEEPYYQPKPKPPAPFASVVGGFSGDPSYKTCSGDFGGCDEGWAVILKKSQNIHVGGAGTYSWFDSYTQECIDKHACQLVLWDIAENYDGVRLQHVISIGAKYIAVHEGKGILATDNLAIEEHPSWSQISVLDAKSAGRAPENGNPGEDPGETCNTNDNTWAPEATRDGDIFEERMLNSSFSSTKQFVTIVNLTPYLFRYDFGTSNAYQINTDFGNIPAGRSRQNVCEYRAKVNSNPKDDNADLYYDVVDTKVDKVLHRFHIKCTTNMESDHPRRTIIDLAEWGLGYRELEDPREYLPVTWAITGSEAYGYYHSLDWKATGHDAWMAEHGEALKKRKLRQLLVPGSHDAGMSKIQEPVFANEHNTQTQGINLHDQLRAGSRYLDFRVVSHEGVFYTAHINGIKQHAIVGALGESLSEAIDHINEFSDANPGEVVVLWLKELGEIITEGFNEKDRQWNKTMTDRFWNEMAKIHNLCPNLKPPIEDQTLEDLWKWNDGKGCVIVIQQGWLSDSVTKKDPSRGFYDNDDMGRKDWWSATGDIKYLIEDQTKQYDKNTAYLISQWQLTPDALASTYNGLQAYAVFLTNPTVYWAGLMAMSPTGYPSVILNDYLGVVIKDRFKWDDLGLQLKMLALGVNLYLASENCKIDNRRHPFLKPKPKSARIATSWNGAVFANGTRIERIPPDWKDPFCTKILLAGTVYGNGSVLIADTPNPEC